MRLATVASLAALIAPRTLWVGSLVALVVVSGRGEALAAPGDLDRGFGGGDGLVTTDFSASNDVVTALVLQPDGKLVAAGRCSNDFCLARYNPDGSLDESFDGDGKVMTNVVGADSAAAVALQADGKLVVAGSCRADDGMTKFCIVRYSAGGAVDDTFGGDGVVLTAFGTFDNATAIVVQPDGKLVVAGECFMGATTGDDFCLARYEGDSFVDLKDILEGLGLPQGTERRLMAILDAAEAATARGSLGAASWQLNAFINQVEAQRGKTLGRGARSRRVTLTHE